ncbi:APC family permease [Amycolatopsis sp. NPDC059090]|uniref:APC family permease n=1 Tax=unclassified Amycolatopsis TaxID=2618356 RepID=UPI00366A6D1D
MTLDSSDKVATDNGGLKKGALGIAGLVAVATGGVSPEYSALLTGSIVAGIAGGATPAAFVLAGVGMFAFGLVMASLSRHVSAAGGLYSFARKGLGSDVGYVTGWLYLGIAVIVTPATFISSAFLVQNFFAAALPKETWLSASWVPWALILTPILLACAFVGVQVSVRLLLGLTVVGIAAVLVLDFAILAKGGANGIDWSSLSPFSLHGVSIESFLLGLGLAVTCIAGSEGAVFMAEEARNPRRSVPRAIMLTMGIVVLFYLLTSLALTSGLGSAKMGDWGTLGANVVTELSDRYLVGWFGRLLLAVVATAGITGALAFTNYAARLLFEWGREAHLPRVFARTHARFRTPVVALGTLAAASLAGCLISWAWQGGSAQGGLVAFSWMYVVDAVLIAVIYPVVAIAGSVVGHRVKSGFVVKYVAPVIVVALIGISVKAQFFPLPASPYNTAVFAAAVWLALGIVIRAVMRKRSAKAESEGIAEPALEHGELAAE